MITFALLLALTVSTSQGCDQWNILLDVNADASNFIGHLSEDECLWQCNLYWNCAGVDMDFDQWHRPQCWFHDRTSIELAKAYGNVKHARKPYTCSSNIPCKTTWSVTFGNHGFGATEKPEYTTENTCLSACANDMNCFAVDVNRDRPSGANLCWFFDHAVPASQRADIPLIDHFSIEDTTCYRD